MNLNCIYQTLAHNVTKIQNFNDVNREDFDELNDTHDLVKDIWERINQQADLNQLSYDLYAKKMHDVPDDVLIPFIEESIIALRILCDKEQIDKDYHNLKGILGHLYLPLRRRILKDTSTITTLYRFRNAHRCTIDVVAEETPKQFIKNIDVFLGDHLQLSDKHTLRLAQSIPVEFFKSYHKFSIPAHYKETYAVLAAVTDPEIFEKYFLKISYSQKNQTEIPKILSKQKLHVLAKCFPMWDMPTDLSYKLTKKIAREDPKAFKQNIRNFKIPPELQVDFSIFLMDHAPEVLASYFDQFNLPKELHEDFCLKIANKCPFQICKHLMCYQLSKEMHIELADLFLKIKPVGLCKYYHHFQLPDSYHFTCAEGLIERKPEALAKYFYQFPLTDEKKGEVINKLKMKKPKIAAFLFQKLQVPTPEHFHYAMEFAKTCPTVLAANSAAFDLTPKQQVEIAKKLALRGRGVLPLFLKKLTLSQENCEELALYLLANYERHLVEVLPLLSVSDEVYSTCLNTLFESNLNDFVALGGLDTLPKSKHFEVAEKIANTFNDANSVFSALTTLVLTNEQKEEIAQVLLKRCFARDNIWVNTIYKICASFKLELTSHKIILEYLKDCEKITHKFEYMHKYVEVQQDSISDTYQFADMLVSFFPKKMYRFLPYLRLNKNEKNQIFKKLINCKAYKSAIYSLDHFKPLYQYRRELAFAAVDHSPYLLCSEINKFQLRFSDRTILLQALSHNSAIEYSKISSEQEIFRILPGHIRDFQTYRPSRMIDLANHYLEVAPECLARQFDDFNLRVDRHAQFALKLARKCPLTMALFIKKFSLTLEDRIECAKAVAPHCPVEFIRKLIDFSIPEEVYFSIYQLIAQSDPRVFFMGEFDSLKKKLSIGEWNLLKEISLKSSPGNCASVLIGFKVDDPKEIMRCLQAAFRNGKSIDFTLHPIIKGKKFQKIVILESFIRNKGTILMYLDDIVFERKMREVRYEDKQEQIETTIESVCGFFPETLKKFFLQTAVKLSKDTVFWLLFVHELYKYYSKFEKNISMPILSSLYHMKNPIQRAIVTRMYFEEVLKDEEFVERVSDLDPAIIPQKIVSHILSAKGLCAPDQEHLLLFIKDEQLLDIVLHFYESGDVEENFALLFYYLEHIESFEQKESEIRSIYCFLALGKRDLIIDTLRLYKKNQDPKTFTIQLKKEVMDAFKLSEEQCLSFLSIFLSSQNPTAVIAFYKNMNPKYSRGSILSFRRFLSFIKQVCDNEFTQFRYPISGPQSLESLFQNNEKRLLLWKKNETRFLSIDEGHSIHFTDDPFDFLLSVKNDTDRMVDFSFKHRDAEEHLKLVYDGRVKLIVIKDKEGSHLMRAFVRISDVDDKPVLSLLNFFPLCCDPLLKTIITEYAEELATNLSLTITT